MRKPDTSRVEETKEKKGDRKLLAKPQEGELGRRIADLSPSKRTLLEVKLKLGAIQSDNHPILPRAKRHQAPLSFAQERLWFLDQLYPGNCVYNLAKAVRLNGQLDIETLQRAISGVLFRHESLRSIFSHVDGEPVQRVVEPGPVELAVVDLSDCSGEQREKEGRRLLVEKSRIPFDLSKDLMLRATLLRMDQEQHILLLVLHHIVSDGWSISLLLREISVLYEAFSLGEPPPLPELPLQYGDFAIWQREWLQGEVLQSQLAYWQRQLKGPPPVLSLPSDHPRAKMQTFRGARESLLLSQTLTEALKELSRREGVTLFMTLLAAFQTLLYRHTGQDDICVGSPIAGRNRIETENLIGLFINTLVLRTDLSGNPKFRELLERVREVALGAYSHQDLPFEKLVEEEKPERDMSLTPLFQILFVFQNAPSEKLELPGFTSSLVRIDNRTAKFDLSLYMVMQEQSLLATLEYDTDLFEPSTIRRMAGHFQTLLESIATNPEQHIAQLPILTEKECHQSLVKWNDTTSHYPEDLRIAQLFEAQVDKNPDALAVISEEECLTYSQLNHQANQLAFYLKGLGVGPEVLVGVCLERSARMVVALLGILKAGGAYLPLDPLYPKDRLSFIVEDAGVSVVLTQTSLSGVLPKLPSVVNLDSDWQQIAKNSLGALEGLRSSNLAYVIYTSGSTGRPKGVEICNQSVVNFLFSMRECLGVTPRDLFLALTTLSFDISVLEIFLPLMVGGQLVVASRADSMDGRILAELIARHRISIMQATPVTWRMLLESGWEGSSQLKVLCGGEALSPELADMLLKKSSSVWNLYGPTETTIWSTIKNLGFEQRPVTIGRPIANTEIFLLDSYGQAVPVGVPGEVHIGGAGLARGYRRWPKETARKFIQHPFSADPEARLYKTGDLARYRADGEIEFLGRVDHQIKIRGHRIEPGEIEKTLLGHPLVRQAVVVVSDDGNDKRRLLAYVVTEKGESLTADEMHDHVKEKLPLYMVPSAFCLLENLPLTPNGKIDRKSLPGLDPSGEALKRKYVAPRDTLERQLATLWESVLERRPIGIHEDLFDVGGHSLLAARLFARMESELGIHLPLATLFQAPNIAALADLQRGDWSPSWASLVPLQSEGSRLPLFCVHGAGGNILLYRDLARHLGSDQPVYGLQSAGLDGKEAPLRSLADMANRYISEIRTVQPAGPYHLAGYCLGGGIALEMAQQLRLQGEEVALLALLETYNPKASALDGRQNLLRSFQNIQFHLANLVLAPGKERLNFLVGKARVAKGRIKKHLLSWLPRNFSQNNIPASTQVTLSRINDAAFLEYQPDPYPGKAILFRPNRFFSGRTDPEYGWKKVFQEGVDVNVLPVYPRGMLVEPFVKLLADQLKRYL